MPTVVDAQSSAGFEGTQGYLTRGKSAEGFKLRRMDAWLGRLNGACGAVGSVSGAVVSCAGGLAPVFTKGVQRSQPQAQKGPGAAASTGQSREGSHQRGFSVVKWVRAVRFPPRWARGPAGTGTSARCGLSGLRWELAGELLGRRLRLLRGWWEASR